MGVSAYSAHCPFCNRVIAGALPPHDAGDRDSLVEFLGDLFLRGYDLHRIYNSREVVLQGHSDNCPVNKIKVQP
jgi:hypothetical protein